VPRPEQAVSRDALEARAVLLSLLEAAYGSTDDGRAALERALRGAERTELPASVSDLLSFVRTGLLPVLSEDLGPRLTMTLLEDFIAAYEIRTGVTVKESATRARVTPRPREQRVLLVDADRVGRTTLARGLARQKCLVTSRRRSRSWGRSRAPARRSTPPFSMAGCRRGSCSWK